VRSFLGTRHYGAKAHRPDLFVVVIVEDDSANRRHSQLVLILLRITQMMQ